MPSDPGDPYRKVRNGDPLRIGSSVHNDTLDVIADFKRRRGDIDSPPLTSTFSSTIVDIFNDSGSDRGAVRSAGHSRTEIHPG